MHHKKQRKKVQNLKGQAYLINALFILKMGSSHLAKGIAEQGYINTKAKYRREVSMRLRIRQNNLSSANNNHTWSTSNSRLNAGD